MRNHVFQIIQHKPGPSRTGIQAQLRVYMGTTATLEDAEKFVKEMGGGVLIGDRDNGSTRLPAGDRWTWNSTGGGYTVSQHDIKTADELLASQTQTLRTNALAKLTMAERAALGL